MTSRTSTAHWLLRPHPIMSTTLNEAVDARAPIGLLGARFSMHHVHALLDATASLQSDSVHLACPLRGRAATSPPL